MCKQSVCRLKSVLLHADAHCSPAMQCKKEMEDQLTAGKKFKFFVDCSETACEHPSKQKTELFNFWVNILLSLGFNWL